MDLFILLNALLLIVGGVLALSGIIVAKKPDAKQTLDKLVPYQAGIGIGLLALGVLNLLRMLGSLFTLIRLVPMFGMTLLALFVMSILLGFMFGIPLVSKWTANNANAQHKAMELAQKIAPYQVMIGGIGLIAALLTLAYRFGIMGQNW